MVSNATVHMIDMYKDEATPLLYLSSYFQTPPKNFYTAEKVSLDVIRDTEEVAVVVQDLTAGARENELTFYQNKGFTPPVVDELATITAFDTIKRQPGQDVFTDPDYMENAKEMAFNIMHRIELKIRRHIEVQCAQVLQTGKLNLLDKSGRPLFALDYGARSSHFPTASVNWGTTGYVPLIDIANLAQAVRRDGKRVPNLLIMGTRAFRDFFASPDVQKLYDVRRFDFGQIGPKPAPRPGGGSYKGNVVIDNYNYDIYVYDGTYQDPQSGSTLNYVTQDSVIMMSENTRLDLTYGAIPILRRSPEPALQAFLPPRISDGATQLDLTTNVYVSPDGKHLKLELATRPLAIPTAIDCFGCLTTRV